MIVPCDLCGKEFNKSPSQIKATNHNFCSRSCAGTFNGRRRRGPYKKRDKRYKEARRLRRENFGYRTIAKKLGGDISWKTIRGWVSDIPADPQIAHKKAMRSRKKNRKPIGELSSSPAIRKRLIEARGYLCEVCKISEWMGEKIVLEMHHINGIGDDNRLSNLQLLCPNCHSQTPNYRNKNGDSS